MVFNRIVIATIISNAFSWINKINVIILHVFSFFQYFWFHIKQIHTFFHVKYKYLLYLH